jgi:predicted Ser/Thr protein kinase
VVDTPQAAGSGSDGESQALPEDIFNDALEMRTEQRTAFLARACAGNDALRSQIEEMLSLADSDLALLPSLAGEAVPSRLGKYELLEERGRGGMGIVFAACDTQLDRLVALKLLPASMTRDDASRARFTREARLLATLKDERIATIYTFEEVDDYCFLTMEWVEGRTLAERINDGPLPLCEAVRVCQQIAEALAITHAHQIVHRDLKPSNVMITPAGGVKILDFGIARALDDLARPDGTANPTDGGLTAARGTPGYMAPEQFLGGANDHRCDLWALGCVLYECLTGQRAIIAVDADNRSALDDVPAFAPAPVWALLGDCLTIDPGKREASAGRAARILAGALADLDGRGRRRRVRTGFALATLVVVAALAFALWGRQAPGPIESVEVADSRVLRAKDVAGNTVWVRALPAALATRLLEPGGEWTLDAPKLLRRGGQVHGIVAATDGVSAADASGIWCLAAQDGRPAWRWDTTWQRPVNAMGTLRILCTTLIPWPGREDPAIAVVMWDRPWYGSAVQFLDAQGQSLGTYYHPGALEYISALSPGPDGAMVYVLAGLNSSARFVPALNPLGGRAHCGCLVMLRPPDVSGQGFPYSEGLPEARDWPGMPRAHELAYVAIPLLHPSFDARVNALDIGKNPDGTTKITARTSDGRYFFFDETLRPLSCYVRTNSVADSLQALGQAQFLPVMVVRDGETTWYDIKVAF